MRIQSFIRAIHKIIDRNRVEFSEAAIAVYCRNVCAATPFVHGIIYPKTRLETQGIIKQARQFRVPLYPISTGKNWGLGARIPSSDGCVMIDFAQMNRILSFDPYAGIIEIEPGVTQEQVAQYLIKKKAKFVLNVTGSSKHSSIVGNALERGVAHYGSRVHEVMAMEVVLGNGEVLSAGGTVVPRSSTKHTYAFGLGPDLRGLFFQSGLGVVTSCTIRLMPIRECLGVVTFAPKPGTTFGEFLRLLEQANTGGLIPGNLHISNRARRASVITPLYARTHRVSIEQAKLQVLPSLQSEWSASASYSGTKPVVKATYQELQRRYSGKVHCSILYRDEFEVRARKSKLLQAIRGTYFHSTGEPSSDSILSLGYGLEKDTGEDPAASDVGTLFMVPVIPFRSKSVLATVRIVKETFKRFGFMPYITFNLLEERNLEGVINLVFNRKDQETGRKAHKCIQKTLTKLEGKAIFPTRLSVFHARSFRGFDPGYKSVINQLDNIFDPARIISPGRYGLSEDVRK